MDFGMIAVLYPPPIRTSVRLKSIKKVIMNNYVPKFSMFSMTG